MHVLPTAESRFKADYDCNGPEEGALGDAEHDESLARISHQIATISLDLCSHKEFSFLGNTHWYSARSENPL
jgi:hypothetical protein